MRLKKVFKKVLNLPSQNGKYYRVSKAPHYKFSAVPGELTSKFTMSKKPYIWSWLCDAYVKMYLHLCFEVITVLCQKNA